MLESQRFNTLFRFAALTSRKLLVFKHFTIFFMKIRYLTILLILASFASPIFGQSVSDSLRMLSEQSKTDSLKTGLLTELSQSMRRKNLDSAFNYAKQASDLASTLPSSKTKVEAVLNLGKFCLYKGKYDTAVIVYKTARKYAEEYNDNYLTALALHSIGNANIYLQKNDSALSYYLPALSIREKIRDTAGIAATTNNIGLIYWNLKNYEKALFYYQRSLDTELILNNEQGIAESYNNVGLVYWNRKDYPKALDYFQKSLDIKLRIDDQNGAGTAYNNIGLIYRGMKDYKKAISYLRKSETIFVNLESNIDIANTYNNLASCYIKLNKTDSAEYYAAKALPIAKELGSLTHQKDSYQYLAEINFTQKNYKDAYNYLYNHTSLKDSLLNEQSSKQIAEAETKYETAKKEREIEVQNLKLKENETELAFQKTVNILTFIIIGIIVVFLLFVLKLLKDKRKANNELSYKNAEISQQKEEITAQANNLQEAYDKISQTNIELTIQKGQISEQNVIISFANEQIKAGIRYAYTIQKSMLPFPERISQLFEHYIVYNPKDIVSGDFYWMSEIFAEQNKKTSVFVVADCTGHGVPGAFMSLTGMHLLDKIVHVNALRTPADILNKLNEYIGIVLNQTESNNRDGMDLSVIAYTQDVLTNEVEIMFEGAKRNLMYYSGADNEIRTIKGSRKSIGGFATRNTPEFENKHIKLNTEDIIYLYSDGITDQNNPQRQRFGTENLKNYLLDNALKPFEYQRIGLQKTIDEWRAGSEQRDDITFIAIRLRSLSAFHKN